LLELCIQEEAHRFGFLRIRFPEIRWFPWLFFSNIPKNFWERKSRRSLFFSWLSVDLALFQHSDWYLLTREQVILRGGTSLLSRYRTLTHFILEHFEFMDWKMWKFHELSLSFLSESDVRRYFYDKLKLDSIPFQYPKISPTLFSRRILKSYGSFSQFVVSVFPEMDWRPWFFFRKVEDWEGEEHFCSYFVWLGQQLSFFSTHDWK